MALALSCSEPHFDACSHRLRMLCESLGVWQLTNAIERNSQLPEQTVYHKPKGHGNMTTKTFFLKDIRKDNYRQSLSSEEQAALDKYLQEMEHGPGHSDMDITWMDEGRGYYVHEHFLYSIKDEQERDIYLKKLREDIDTWLSEDPTNYMVGRVRDSLVEN
jgi:hypothetical protein